MAEKLKIAYVLDDSLDSTDGVQQYVLTVSEWMRAQGHECHFLTGHTTRTDIENIHSTTKVLKVRFNKNRMATPLPANKKRLARLLNDQKFDVVHVQMPYSPLMAGRLLNVLPDTTAAFGTFHILPFGRLHTSANKLLGKVNRQTMHRFDGIVAVSPAAQAFAKDAYSIDTEVLPNAVNMQKFLTKKPMHNRPRKLRIVFLGRLVERKGAQELLTALDYLQTHEPAFMASVECVMVGKGKDLGRLRSYVSSHHLDHTVTFAGFIDEPDKPALLASADLAVFPSLGGESFGIVLIEAMAAGAGVVLGGDNPGYRSVLGERPELLCNPRQTEAFAKRIKQLLTNQELHAKLHSWQVRKVHQYDIAQVGPKLLSYYQAAIKQRKQG